jgi:hypothetical protein
MKRSLSLVLGCAAVFASFYSSAQAQILNVQFTDNVRGNALNGDSWGPTVSALAYTGTTWTSTFADSGSDLPYSDDSASTIGYTVSNVNTSNNGGSSLDMFQETFVSNAMTLTINGLSDSKSYDIYLYGAYDSIFNSTFTIGSATKATAGVSGNDSTFTEGVSYVEFTNIAPTSNAITVSITPGNGFALIEGFQLAVAPEPSTYAMMLVGAGALVWFARRKLA